MVSSGRDYPCGPDRGCQIHACSESRRVCRAGIFCYSGQTFRDARLSGIAHPGWRIFASHVARALSSNRRCGRDRTPGVAIESLVGPEEQALRRG